MAAVPSIGRATAVTPRPASRGAVATHDLYERYAKQIYNFCLHQLGNREEAEDATQSTFLNAFRGLERGVEPEFESAWLFKIAHNVCLTRQRSSFRRRRVESPGDLDAIQDLLPSPQRDADELIRLTDALHGMPEQQRKALLLREWQGLSYKEIGEELELSQPAVETLLFRARRSLAQGLVEEPKQEKRLRKRLRTGGDMGSVAALVKTLLFSGGAKVAATVATVAATGVVAATPAVRHDVATLVGPAPKPAVTHVATTVAPETKAAPAHTAPAPAAIERLAAPDTVRPVAARPKPTRAVKLTHTASRPAFSGGRVHGAPAHRTHPLAAVPTTPVAPAPEPAPAPVQPAPDPEPTVATPAPAHEQPATPPGQAKKDEGKKNEDRTDSAPPSAASPAATPPGQAKKNERRDASTQPDAPAPAATPPGQAKKDEGKKGNGKKSEPPAQPQPQPQPQEQLPAPQLQTAAPAPVAVQAQLPPGQAKKADKDASAPVAAPATAPAPVSTPVATPPAPEPAPAPPVATDADKGNGNGNGKKK
jgi:RNA polymerase sigma-70 factor (ECF subfamily)